MKDKIKGTFSNIKDKVNEIPRPDLEAMKDSIKGTFSDIKDKVNGMFEN
jgi:Flp pilus assembly pilin Flp